MNLPFKVRPTGPVSRRPVEEDAALQGVSFGIEGFMKQIKDRVKKMPRFARKLLFPLELLFFYFYRFVFRLTGTVPAASLYYLHAPYQFPVVYCQAKRYGVPIIYDAHDFYPVIHETGFYTLLESACIRNAKAVVTVSDGVARLIQERFGRRPVVIRNCQDARLERMPEKNLRQMLGLSTEDFLLVTIGQAKPGQAVFEALEAMKGLPSRVHLALVGKNTERNMGLVTRSGLQSRVHLLPAVKPDQVVPFIRTADAALILYYAYSANYEHCLPNGFFQSIAADLPLLYPELPEIKRLAEEYELGIPIDPRSPDSIRISVSRMLDQANACHNYKNNVRLARQALSWEQEEVILRKVVGTVLGDGPGAL
jgi:hypothetical protein